MHANARRVAADKFRSKRDFLSAGLSLGGMEMPLIRCHRAHDAIFDLQQAASTGPKRDLDP